ncbi:GAF domain-containing protein [Synoicihabitans lomoniglobus]|uniref:GAF domain-containing protein n=1 Tax=Synoicihabitans lomoniglobus TaxID=2909285 RepID=A0AAF0CPT7_9BACT|nr:GAF domain-containing protein [Opitutaceae bacterium LMO-M01]WED65843.1 GAF domain-containing protein [Opitutaceae bacterium LMO-M01]
MSMPTIPPTTRTFIKVTEVWIPDRSGQFLEFSGGIYGDLNEFRRISRHERFNHGEGLPGAAWAQRRPVILSEFTTENFKRTAAAHAAGLTCGIAYPVFAGEFLTGVLVFFCGEDEGNVGAIEVWGRDPTDQLGLKLDSGYYGNLKEFEFISRHTTFRKGSGLPGMVWDRYMPVILDNMDDSGPFSRALDATRAGITTALGLPCSASTRESFVLCLLSVGELPIAQRYEIWEPDESLQVLHLKDAADESDVRHFEQMSTVQLRRGEGLIGEVWRSGAPQIADKLDMVVSPPFVSAKSAGLDHAVALPVLGNGFLKAVVVWYF